MQDHIQKDVLEPATGSGVALVISVNFANATVQPAFKQNSKNTVNKTSRVLTRSPTTGASLRRRTPIIPDRLKQCHQFLEPFGGSSVVALQIGEAGISIFLRFSK